MWRRSATAAPRLPDAFAMLTSIVARWGGVAAGGFQLVEPTVNGPSGARLLGRLCHGDARSRGSSANT